MTPSVRHAWQWATGLHSRPPLESGASSKSTHKIHEYEYENESIHVFVINNFGLSKAIRPHTRINSFWIKQKSHKVKVSKKNRDKLKKHEFKSLYPANGVVEEGGWHGIAQVVGGQQVDITRERQLFNLYTKKQTNFTREKRFLLLLLRGFWFVFGGFLGRRVQEWRTDNTRP